MCWMCAISLPNCRTVDVFAWIFYGHFPPYAFILFSRNGNFFSFCIRLLINNSPCSAEVQRCKNLAEKSPRLEKRSPTRWARKKKISSMRWLRGDTKETESPTEKVMIDVWHPIWTLCVSLVLIKLKSDRGKIEIAIAEPVLREIRETLKEVAGNWLISRAAWNGAIRLKESYLNEKKCTRRDISRIANQFARSRVFLLSNLCKSNYFRISIAARR